MVAGIIIAIIAAIGGTAIYELVKRPLSDFLSGLVLTEEAPVRTVLTMYVQGVVSLDYFKSTMARHNIKTEDQQAYIDFANFKIAEAKEGAAQQQLKVVTSHLSSMNTKYDKLDDDALDVEFDSFSAAVNTLIDKLQVEMKPIELRLTAAVKKGEEGPLIDELKDYVSRIGDYKLSIQDKRTEILAKKKARLDDEFKAVRALQPTIPGIPPIPWPGLPLPTPTTAVFNITSEPSGADVGFNGVNKGLTPLTISMPAAAGYDLTVIKSGYQTWGVSTLAEAGKTYTYHAVLSPIPVVTPPAITLKLCKSVDSSSPWMYHDETYTFTQSENPYAWLELTNFSGPKTISIAFKCLGISSFTYTHAIPAGDWAWYRVYAFIKGPLKKGPWTVDVTGTDGTLTKNFTVV